MELSDMTYWEEFIMEKDPANNPTTHKASLRDYHTWLVNAHGFRKVMDSEDNDITKDSMYMEDTEVFVEQKEGA